jgi:hypothetical protein
MSISNDDLGQFWLQIVGPIGDEDDDRTSRIGFERPEPLTGDEKRMLVGAAEIPQLAELLGERCGHHPATSPAALSCANAVIRELYWRGAEQLLKPND